MKASDAADRVAMHRISVVIPNYNYAQFVAIAIDSALALDWPDVEVVVVDDGSTDNSLEVIRAYGSRLTLIATENASQRVAVNRGVAASTGDVVIVLDSDDVLPRGLPQSLARVWGPSISKAQFLMQRIDVAGQAVGEPFPRHGQEAGPSKLRHWMRTTSAYPTPPGSGNAYSRWFLDRVLPVDESAGRASDSALLAAAPLLGDVIVVRDVVVGYRQHDGNDSDLLSDPTRFGREVERAAARWELARRVARPDVLDPRAIFRSREVLQLRVAAARLDPGARPLPGDSRRRMLVGALASPWHPGPESWRTRLMVAGWCVATLLAPISAARRLVELRYRRT